MPKVATDSPALRDFRARVARCEKRAKVTRKQRQRWLRERIRQKRVAAAAASPFNKVLALLTGGVAVVLARLVRAVWLGQTLTGNDAQTALMQDVGLALAVALVIGMLLGLPGRRLILVQMMGIAVMTVSMHDLVHAAPGLWEQAFPKAWVTDVLRTTLPNSLLIEDRLIAL